MSKPKLLTKAKFAELCNASRSTISSALKRDLIEAVVNDKIDINHPAAQFYIKKRESFLQNKMTDSELKEAIKNIINSGEYWTTSIITKKLRANINRVKSALKDMSIDEPEQKGRKLVGSAVTREEKKNKSTLQGLNEILDETVKRKVPEDIRDYHNMRLCEIIEQFGTDIAFCDWLKAAKAIEDIMTARLKNAATKKELVSRKLVQIGVLDQIETAHNKLLTDGAKTIARRIIAMHEGGRRIEDCEIFASNQISSYIKPMRSKIEQALEDVSEH